jgi:HAD superfamily hydrolase (TIGR01509 family)
MDGVLVDAQEWHYEALNAALRPHGFEISRPEHERRFDGLSTRRKLELLTHERGLPVDLHDAISAEKQRLTAEFAAQYCRPVKSRVELLAALRQRGYKLGVASNSIRSSVVMLMRASGLLGYLDLILSNEDVTRPKPAPEIYERAFQQLELQPWQVLIVEDSAHGLAAAYASGAHVLRVRSPRDVTLANIERALSHLGQQREEAAALCT